MSDQPKPTTGERDYLDPNRVDKVYPKTKPTTGEWTSETVNQLLYNDNKESRQSVADAHNAELAAVEAELIWAKGCITDMEQQLAAERESLGRAGEILIERDATIQQLREQLAAAQAAIAQGWDWDRCGEPPKDTTALDAAIAAATSEKVDFLQRVVDQRTAKVKEK